MSCGLGAIILVFMLVKKNTAPAAVEPPQLEAELSRLEQVRHELSQDRQTAAARRRAADTRIQALSAELARLQAEAQRSLATTQTTRARITSLEQAIRHTAAAKTADTLDIPQTGEEQYLIGLKVEGRKIGLLIDSSASMTDETLIAVIRRKNASDAEKQAGPKWRRTKAIAGWLLARLPAGSEVTAVTYSGAVRHLGGRGWKPSRTAAALEHIVRDLDAVVPSGPTNLHAGLDALYALQPTAVYLITDGLPTQGNAGTGLGRFNPLSACGSLSGRSRTVSGACRASLFRYAIGTVAARTSPVNVILLPIEGDPEAAYEYWRWTALARGMLITPADSWP